MAHRRINLDAIGGIADMDGRVASAKSVAIEPKPTSGARTGFRSELAHGDMVFFIIGR